MTRCHDTSCTATPHWQLAVAGIPGFHLYACPAHLLGLLGSGRNHVLTPLETQPA
jgi:hypothetical protein